MLLCVWSYWSEIEELEMWQMKFAQSSVSFFQTRTRPVLNVYVHMCFPRRRAGYCADWLWRIIMGLEVSRLPQWDDNHSGCPLISTGIGASIKLETLRDDREHCCEREHVCGVFSGPGVTCRARGGFVWISCEAQGEKMINALFFFHTQADEWIYVLWK